MLIRLTYLWLRNRRVRQFLVGARRARRVQHEVLWNKLRRNADSDFGRQYRLADIRSIADFRRQLPISTYEDYRPYVERVKRGEISAMFGPGTRVLMFALTSGTTEKSKYIPITPEFLREYKEGWNLWGVRAYIDHLRAVRMYNLQLSSDWRKFYTEGGIPCGNISGLAADTAPLISRPVFILPRELMKISDPLAKQYAAMRIAMATPRIGIVMTANPSTLVEFARFAHSHRESLIRDIHDGTLSEEYEIAPEIRRAIRPKTATPKPARARELERLADLTGEMRPADFWPDLQLLAVWTGGPVGAYLPRLKQYYGRVSVRDHGLSASEGRITIPFRDGTSAGVLDYTSQYFEFIPEEEHDGPNPTILEAHELIPGRNYFVLLTTSSGFYRYDIHDVVRCVGKEGEAPVIEFLNKGAHFSSITGEKISELQISMSVRRAFEDLGQDLETFTVAPRWGDPPGYVLLIEPGVDRQRHRELARAIDRNLGQLNFEYGNRLETHRLRPLMVREIPAGTWTAYRSARIARLGGSLEQYKHPCLVSDLDFIDKLDELDTHASLAASGS
jgi:hypothetical protein